MMARGFKPVGWVAAAGAAALSCYMVSLNVASERAELAALEQSIIETKQEIRTLHTELGTRGRLAQLDRWNVEVLALSAPTSAQFLQDEFRLARFDQRAPSFDEQARVRMASATEEPEAALPPAAAPDQKTPRVIFASAPAPAAKEPQSLVRPASMVMLGEMPSAPAGAPRPKAKKPALAKKQGLIGDDVLAEIGSEAKSETADGGAGGQ
jgi:hypothetical protein